MEEFYFEKEWEETLQKQRELLQYTSFTRNTAFELASFIIDLAKNEYKDAVAIRILEDETIIYAYKMEGTSSENDWWMDRKYATSRWSGLSSLETFVKARLKKTDPFWQGRMDNFAICGGCYPVELKKGSKSPYTILVSGLEHHLDHQIIADAMAKQLRIEIPSLVKSS